MCNRCRREYDDSRCGSRRKCGIRFSDDDFFIDDFRHPLFIIDGFRRPRFFDKDFRDDRFFKNNDDMRFSGRGFRGY